VAGHCNASQDAQDAWDAENTSLASGRNADGSDAGSVFADVGGGSINYPNPSFLSPEHIPRFTQAISHVLTSSLHDY